MPSATRQVPSGELSSAMMISYSTPPKCLSTSSTKREMFSASLKVGAIRLNFTGNSYRRVAASPIHGNSQQICDFRLDAEVTCWRYFGDLARRPGAATVCRAHPSDSLYFQRQKMSLTCRQ